ncbi:hypothetical protein AN958_07564 [Leucoagaricus sp. SymC.cos]|nr:hypothetical protein AN958_07564 [Leucoagaricus sp. SymC.cos]
MAASLVQPTVFCTCNCHQYSHSHHHHHLSRNQQIGFAGCPAIIAAGALSHSAGSENHTFSTAPSVAATTAISGINVGVVEEPRAYPFKGGHVKHTHASYRRDSLPELSTSTVSSNAITNGHTNGAAHPSKLTLTTPITAAATPLTPSPSQHSTVANKWALCLPVPIPHGLPNPTLESLTYTIRYASLNTGSASVQTDVVLAHGPKLSILGSHSSGGSEGAIVTDYSKVPLYSHYGASGNVGGYGPPMLNEALGLGLVSVPAFKNTAGSEGGWSHYLDHQKVYPNVRIEEGSYAAVAAGVNTHGQAHDDCHVYLFFHVYEYPSAEALRSLSVDISATWNDGEALKRAKEEREKEIHELRLERERLVLMKRDVEMTITKLEESVRRANEEAEKRLKGEIAMEKELKEREEELLEVERKAKESYEGRMDEETKRLRQLEEKEKEAQALYEKRAKEEQEREETERKAKEDAERHARDEAEWKAHEDAERKARKDAEHWAKEQAELREKEEERWARIAHEEAERKAREAEHMAREAERMKREAERMAREEAELEAARALPTKIADAPDVADDRMQEHIASVAAKLGQKCKNGYAWEKKAHGYKCSGGGHFISFKDLGIH